MPTSPGPLSAALEALWESLRTDCQLPPTIITVSATAGSPNHSHERFRENDDGAVTGVLVDVPTMERGGEAILTAVLHDAAHMKNWRDRVADTARYGAYHNGRFLKAAQCLGLELRPETTRTAGGGYADVVLTPETQVAYADVIAELSEAAEQALPHLSPPPDVTRTRPPDRLSVQCQCSDPRLLRISKSQWERGPITCGVCGAQFVRV
ncbi:hypothetical protein AB0A77_02070 [Streptomyces varsoviensis]|uniref:hypothetical protein n=1 Tax=Streptomyces varsoviensis TaxID=67373 RepID=UPI0033D2F306